MVTLETYDPENPQHKKAFAELNREWLTKYFHVEKDDEKAFADPEGFALKGGGTILFARMDGNIVGTGSLAPMPGKGVFEIAKMAVTEACQAKGIGRMMLQELIAQARMRKARRVFIVSNTALAPAIALYRRHGFVTSAENHHSHYERGDITLELALA